MTVTIEKQRMCAFKRLWCPLAWSSGSKFRLTVMSDA